MRDDAVLFDALESFWRTHVPPSSRICVAVSGGADSVALVHLLSLMQARLSIAKLGIAHVNHRLRGRESDTDERFVTMLARKASLPFHLRRISAGEIPSSGIEAWARNQRYAFFAAVMNVHRYDFMATAHTADDQAETVLLRLMRGTGIRGLAGIAPVRDDHIIRPLLSVQKKSLANWLSNRKLGYREDSSNRNTDFTRNWLRHRFLPACAEKEPHCVKLLATVADSAAEIDRITKPLINKWLSRYVVSTGRTFFSVDRKGMDDDVIATESIMSLLRERNVEFKREHVESIEENKDRIGKTFLLPGGWKYRPLKASIDFHGNTKSEKCRSYAYFLNKQGITWCSNPEAVFRVKRFKKKAGSKTQFSNSNVAFFDGQKTTRKGKLVFRSAFKHEKFWPYGTSGYTEINEFLKKQKLLKDERMRRGVISLGNKEVLWVVGLRTSEKYKITPQTKVILKISYEPG